MAVASFFIDSTIAAGGSRSSSRKFISMQISANAWLDMKSTNSATIATRPETITRRTLLMN
jgi:hypothetical protein